MTTETKRRGRKTREERIIANREEIVSKLVKENKFIRESKFYPQNYWSWAAWDSWAAQGKAGSCPCGCGYYNGTLKNKRAKTNRGGRNEDWPVDVSPKLCYDCVELIHKKIGTTFKKS